MKFGEFSKWILYRLKMQKNDIGRRKYFRPLPFVPCNSNRNLKFQLHIERHNVRFDERICCSNCFVNHQRNAMQNIAFISSILSIVRCNEAIHRLHSTLYFITQKFLSNLNWNWNLWFIIRLLIDMTQHRRALNECVHLKTTFSW